MTGNTLRYKSQSLPKPFLLCPLCHSASMASEGFLHASSTRAASAPVMSDRGTIASEILISQGYPACWPGLDHFYTVHVSFSLLFPAILFSHRGVPTACTVAKVLGNGTWTDLHITFEWDTGLNEWIYKTWLLFRFLQEMGAGGGKRKQLRISACNQTSL